jgi:fatty-acyl-CoA synthase
MGLFGVLLVSWAMGMELTLGTPERFLVSPRTWLGDCAERHATLTVGPSFGLGLALRAASRSLPDARIPMRAWIIGSDRIEWETLRSAIDALGSVGIDGTAFMPAYGLAEATLAVTMTPPGAPIELLEADQAALLAGEVAQPNSGTSATLVGCGRPMPGVEVRIAGDAPVGEICVRSPSLATGYVDDADATAKRFVAGELRTGDRGVVRNDQLYVVGRDDDLLSIAGRNVHASELELLIGREQGVRTGACALVDLLDGERTRLVVMVEPEDGVTELPRLARNITRVVANACAARVDECVFVPRRTLPKTPSGKIQRFRCRELLAGGGMEPLARVPS